MLVAEQGHESEDLEDEPLSRVFTIQLAEIKAQYVFDVPRIMLRQIMQQDTCSMIGVSGGWPEEFRPANKHCQTIPNHVK